MWSSILTWVYRTLPSFNVYAKFRTAKATNMDRLYMNLWKVFINIKNDENSIFTSIISEKSPKIKRGEVFFSVFIFYVIL